MKTETYDYFCWDCKIPWTDNDSISECIHCGEVHHNFYSNEYQDKYQKEITNK